MNLSGAKVMLVGGAGLVGSHIVDKLVETSVREIVVFDNFVRGTRGNLDRSQRHPKVRVVEGSMTDRTTLTRELAGVDGVFLLASLWLGECVSEPRSAWEVNTLGTWNVVEACLAAGVKRIVYSSSASVYGNALVTPMTEDHPFNNRTTYGATKIANEQMLRAIYEQHKFPYVGTALHEHLRSTDGLSRHVRVSVIMKVLDRIFSGQRPIIFGDGSQVYDFVYVEDVADANVLGDEGRLRRRVLQYRHGHRHVNQRACLDSARADGFFARRRNTDPTRRALSRIASAASIRRATSLISLLPHRFGTACRASSPGGDRSSRSRSDSPMIWIVLPAFNEAESLPSLLPKIDGTFRQHALDYRMVVVDDGSVDATPSILAEAAKSLPLDVVTHPINRGLGETERDGFEFVAARCAPDDIDRSGRRRRHPRPELHVRRCWRSSTKATTSSIRRAFSLAAGQRGVSAATARSSAAAPTSSCGWCFRCPTFATSRAGSARTAGAVIRDAVRGVRQQFIQLRGLGFTSTLEMVVKLHLLGCRCAEVPFVLRYDQKESASKMIGSITAFGYFMMAVLYHWPFGGWSGAVSAGLRPLYRHDRDEAVERFGACASAPRRRVRSDFRMCGICGIVMRDARRPADRAALERMARRSVIEGPDGEERMSTAELGARAHAA